MRAERKYRFDASGQIALSLFEQIKLSDLCDLAVRLDNRHSIPATSSNFSLRKNSESFLISRSGKHKRDLNPSDFLLVDLNGVAVAPIAPKASDETLLHALIYKHCSWVECIAHCHAPELESLRPPETKIEGHELLKALGIPDHKTDFNIRVFENNQNMKELALAIEEKQFKQSKADKGPVIFVLARHGIYCGGESIGKTEAYLEALLHLIKLGST